MTDFLLKKRPNIVLIMCDQMRGDCLGIAGHPDVKRHIWILSLQKALIFQMHYSACPSCIPARAALFTGLSQNTITELVIRWYYLGLPAYASCCLVRWRLSTEMVGKMHVHPPIYRCGFPKHDPS